MNAHAYQRIIRDTLSAHDPKPVPPSLAQYSVETITRVKAEPLILQYEWLRNIGRTTLFVGLMSSERQLHGVACFGYGPAGPIRKLIGAPAFCLERGACVHYAPANAASFLITHACKLVYRLTGTARFFAYGDPMAGEYGAVYQAASWLYLGQGLNGSSKIRERRIAILPPGTDPDNPANWKTTRALRRNGKRMTLKAAKAAGWEISKREAKHVYATHVGSPSERRKWRNQLALRTFPYPAPQPELKQRNEHRRK
jgi:hypothetical protein